MKREENSPRGSLEKILVSKPEEEGGRGGFLVHRKYTRQKEIVAEKRREGRERRNPRYPRYSKRARLEKEAAAGRKKARRVDNKGISQSAILEEDGALPKVPYSISPRARQPKERIQPKGAKARESENKGPDASL